MKKPCHPDHSSEIKRLKRIQGQLEGIERMIMERRYCIEILNQTKAVTSAIHSLESSLFFLIVIFLSHYYFLYFLNSKLPRISESGVDLEPGDSGFG